MEIFNNKPYKVTVCLRFDSIDSIMKLSSMISIAMRTSDGDCATVSRQPRRVHRLADEAHHRLEHGRVAQVRVVRRQRAPHEQPVVEVDLLGARVQQSVVHLDVGVEALVDALAEDLEGLGVELGPLRLDARVDQRRVRHQRRGEAEVLQLLKVHERLLDLQFEIREGISHIGEKKNYINIKCI